MKQWKKLVALMLVLTMTLSGTAMALAAESDENPTIYTEGYHVMLGNEYVSFTDATPVNKQGRIMVPFRAILEALGAKVDWVDETRTVTAQTADTFISFQVGQPNIDVTKNGEKSVKVMDVVPYIDPSNDRTYVSTRFVSEALGYTVGWDAEDQTAVIIDYGTLFADADKDFSVLDRLLRSTRSQQDTAYETDLTLSMKTTVEGEVLAEMALSGEFLQKDQKASAKMNLSMDMAGMLQMVFEGTGEGMTDEEIENLKQLDEVQVDLRMDMDKGEMYMLTSANDLLVGEEYKDTWLKVDLNEMYGSMGIDLNALMTQNQEEPFTMKDMLLMMGDASAETMTINTYDQMQITYDMLKDILGDDVLKVTSAGGVTEYRADLTQKAESPEEMDQAGSLRITDDGNGTVTVQLDMTMSDPESGASVQYLVEAKGAKTTAAPAGLPAGAPVVDMKDLMEEL